MWDHHMMPHNWTWGTTMGLFWFFVVLLLVLAVVYAVREYGNRQFAGGPSGRPGIDHESPREVLDRRYAEGEISREEYEQMKDDLKG